MEATDHSLGPWEGADLLATVAANTGSGDDAGLPPFIRFRREIIDLFRRRRAQVLATNDPNAPAVFLLKPQKGSGGDEPMPIRVPMLYNGLTQLTGRLWFTNAAATIGYYVDIPSNDDEAMFRWVAEQLELGGIPAVIIDPRPNQAQVIIYPNGLGDPGNCTLFDLSNEPLTPEKIRKIIDTIHKNDLVTPDAQPQGMELWNGTLPKRNAEKLIQGYLHIGLAATLHTYKIRLEQPSPVGRYDILICENDVSEHRSILHAILELKVLRSRTSSERSVSASTTLDTVTGGVQQAAAYRDEHAAKHAALCCFDMRVQEDPEEKCFEHVRRLASTHQIELWRWYLYSSSATFRAARYDN